MLAGVNGSGKTSVLDAIYAVRRLVCDRARVSEMDVFPPSSRTRFRDSLLQVVEIEASLPCADFRYRLEVEHFEDESKQRISLEQLTLADGRHLFKFERGRVSLYKSPGVPGPEFVWDWSESALAKVDPRRESTLLTAFVDFMDRIVVCALEPRTVAPESRREESKLERNGANFVSWYRHMSLERQLLLSSFQESVKGAVDGLQGVQVESVGRDTKEFVAVFAHDKQPYRLSLDELSGGQCALVILYALVHFSSSQDCALFLDEPDNFLALSELQPLLHKLHDQSGNSLRQVVVCSHSPEFIDHDGGVHGIWLQRETTGVIKSRPLPEVAPDSPLPLSEIIARGWEAP